MAASPLRSASELKTALLLVDVQSGLTTESGFYGTERSTPQFEDNITSLLSSARKYNISQSDQARSIFIAHVFHNSTSPKSPLWPTKPTNKAMSCAAPIDGEPVLSKKVNCAFVGTDLEKMLREQKIRQIIICGIATDHCVSTTVRLAADLEIVKRQDDDLGLVAIIGDASAAFNNRGRFDAETVHAVNLASLEDEFAEVISTKDVLGIVLRSSS